MFSDGDFFRSNLTWTSAVYLFIPVCLLSPHRDLQGTEDSEVKKIYKKT